MHTLVTSSHYQQVLHQIAALSTEEQLRLIGEISSTLRKKIPVVSNPSPPLTDLVATVKGKYAFVPTSSDLFAQSKIREIGIERQIVIKVLLRETHSLMLTP